VTSRPATATAARRVIVNQSFARRYLGAGEPLGKRLGIDGPAEEGADPPTLWATVVGVVPDLYMDGTDNEEPEGMYVPLAQHDRSFVSLLARTRGEPMALARPVRAMVTSVDPNQPLYFVRSLEEAIHLQTWFYRVFGTLFMVFGAVALLLAAVGLYGVMSFSVGRRHQEVGVRMALGAEAKQVVRLIFRQGARQVLIGLGIGLLIAPLPSHFLRMALFGVSPWDPSTFVLIVTVLAATGAVACGAGKEGGGGLAGGGAAGSVRTREPAPPRVWPPVPRGDPQPTQISSDLDDVEIVIDNGGQPRKGPSRAAPAAGTSGFTSTPRPRHVLIHENLVPIRIAEHEARRPRGLFVRLDLQLQPGREQPLLQLADVGERLERLGLRVPAGVEGQDVPLEHPLEQADRGRAVLQDQPSLLGVAAEDLEAELLVEGARGREVLDGEADGKVAELHGPFVSWGVGGWGGPAEGGAGEQRRHGGAGESLGHDGSSGR